MECLMALSISGQLRPKASDILPHLKAYRLVKVSIPPARRRKQNLFEELLSITRCPAWHPCCSYQFRSARTLPRKQMKPQSQISRQLGSHRAEEMPLAQPLNHPATDFAYQATGGDYRVATTRLQHSAPSFRNLSKDFLAEEMKRDYLTEAVCFLIMVSLSAWPIASMVQALSFLK
jgi:hypothetical protein